MSENPYAPPELIQGRQETEPTERSAVWFCLTSAVIGGILMSVSVMICSDDGLLVMAFVTPMLLRRHFMHTYQRPKSEVPNFAWIPVVVALMSIGVTGTLGFVASTIVPQEMTSPFPDWFFLTSIAAGGSIGFEVAVATYLRQRRTPTQLLAPAALTAVMISGICWLAELLNQWHLQNTASSPFIPKQIWMATIAALWFSLSIFCSTLGVDIGIRRRLKRHREAGRNDHA